jgi:hypothetical protein
MHIGYLCAGIGCNILADLANGHEPVFACDIEPDRAGWERAADHGAPEPGVRRVADATAWRMVKDRVAAIGNGQDVLTCAVAWAILGGPVE